MKNVDASKKSISALLWIIFLDQTCITITFPLITLIFFDSQSHLFSTDTPYATRSLWFGFCVALPNVINIFFIPLLSALSDELGRKKILVIEIFAAFFFTFTVAFSVLWGILGLLFLGFMIRGAFARTYPTAQAIIGDIAPKEKKILFMGYLQFAISVGAFLGPILGGYFANRFFFAQLNFSFPFFISALIALMNGLLTLIIFSETWRKPAVKSWEQFNFQAIKKVIMHPHVLRISLVLLLIQISWSMYYQYIPPILKTIYAFNSHQLGWFIGMIAFWLAVATGVGIKVLHRYFDIRQLLLTSCYFVLAGLIMTLLTCTYHLPEWLVWLAAMPVAAGDVIAYSCLTALYSDVVGHEKQGKVMGVCFMVVSFIWASTGFLGGFLLSASPLLPLIIAPLGILFSLILMHAEFGKKLVLDLS